MLKKLIWTGVKPHRFLDEADSELFEWIAHYDGISRALGDKFVAAVEAAVLNVRTYPEIGSKIGRLHKFVITSFPYSVLYANEPGEIVVVAIAPHKRRPGYWRKRLRSLRK
jgi:hypothetical protein